ncbi:UNVERIFIED_CONTAM: hypothetical protein HHA_454210 [Hammondia hammondi]|eukprot:XP_008887633.1 hypothetical protein HHA_454210 [Hammondia hammondi]
MTLIIGKRKQTNSCQKREKRQAGRASRASRLLLVDIGARQFAPPEQRSRRGIGFTFFRGERAVMTTSLRVNRLIPARTLLRPGRVTGNNGTAQSACPPLCEAERVPHRLLRVGFARLDERASRDPRNAAATAVTEEKTEWKRSRPLAKQTPVYLNYPSHSCPSSRKN